MFNWEGTILDILVLDHDYWRSTPLFFINQGLVSSGVDIIPLMCCSWICFQQLQDGAPVR